MRDILYACDMFGSRKRVEKLWLDVYEILLARDCCAALLCALAQWQVQNSPDPHQYDGLISEVIAVRGETAGFSSPSEPKRLAEEKFTEVISRFFREISTDRHITSHPLFLELSRRLIRFPEEITLALNHYDRSLQVYRVWHFGGAPASYPSFPFEINPLPDSPASCDVPAQPA